jgi:hypothetical protein
VDEKSDRETDYAHQRMIRIVAEAERLGIAADEEIYHVDDRGQGIPGAGLTLADLREMVARGAAFWDKIEEIQRLGFDPDDFLGVDDDGSPLLRTSGKPPRRRFRELKGSVEGGADEAPA